MPRLYYSGTSQCSQRRLLAWKRVILQGSNSSSWLHTAVLSSWTGDSDITARQQRAMSSIVNMAFSRSSAGCAL